MDIAAVRGRDRQRRARAATPHRTRRIQLQGPADRLPCRGAGLPGRGRAAARQHPLPDRRRGGDRQARRSSPTSRANLDRFRRCDGAFLPYLGTNTKGETPIRLGFKGLGFIEFSVAGGAWGGPAKHDVHAMHSGWLASPGWELISRALDPADSRRTADDRRSADAARTDADDRELIAQAARDLQPDTFLRELGVSRFKHDEDFETELDAFPVRSDAQPRRDLGRQRRRPARNRRRILRPGRAPSSTSVSCPGWISSRPIDLDPQASRPPRVRACRR